MGIDPNSMIPNFTRALITKDGGITQLNATVHEDAFQGMAARNETCAKLAKNTSGVFQPCDTREGHSSQRCVIKKLSKEPEPTLGICVHFEEQVKEIRDLGLLIIDAQAFNKSVVWHVARCL